MTSNAALLFSTALYQNKVATYKAARGSNRAAANIGSEDKFKRDQGDMRREGGLAEVTLGVESDLGSCSVAPCVGLDLYLYDQKSNKSANKKKAPGWLHYSRD